MTPTRAGLLGLFAGATGMLALGFGGFIVYDELTYGPSSKGGSCDHARYYYKLTTLGDEVLGRIVIVEPDNQELRDPNSRWLVQWRSGGSGVEHLKTEGTGSPSASSTAYLNDTDDGGTRSVWIKRADAVRWCKVTSSLS